MLKNIFAIKNQKGAVSILVFITIMVFIIVLMGSYITISILRESQVKSNIRIRDIYVKDVDNADEIYKEIVDKYE